MSNLLTSLITTASSLSVFERALTVTQNNVTNASTPGYAAQRLSLLAMDFDPQWGLLGGVRAGEIQSARSQYAERAVRQQVESLGFFHQAAASLAAIENLFTISVDSGIPGALNRMFQSFSAWSLTPNSSSARQLVIEGAQKLAESFEQTAAGLDRVSLDTEQQLRHTVNQINELGSRLLEYNLSRRQGSAQDAGLDTKIHVALEELAELVNFTVLYQADGSLTVLLGGETPLVVGESQYRIRLDFHHPDDPPPVYPAGPPGARVLSAEGRDITVALNQGRLGGLLDVRNRILPGLRGDAYQAGDLNLMAKSVADRVNQILASGWILEGPPPEMGVPLFIYDASNDTNVARTLTLDPGITPAFLAAIDPGPPFVSNGIALRLAALAHPQEAADRIDGYSFTEYYGLLAARVGRELVSARDGQDFKAQTTAQARSLRNEISGVSLDQEAIMLIQFQRSYQAVARLVNVLNELTETTLSLLR